MLTLKKTTETTTKLESADDILKYLVRDYADRRKTGAIKAGAKVRVTSRDGVAADMAVGDVGVMVLPGDVQSHVLVAHATAGLMVTAIRTSALEPAA